MKKYMIQQILPFHMEQLPNGYRPCSVARPGPPSHWGMAEVAFYEQPWSLQECSLLYSCLGSQKLH